MPDKILLILFGEDHPQIMPTTAITVPNKALISQVMTNPIKVSRTPPQFSNQDDDVMDFEGVGATEVSCPPQTGQNILLSSYSLLHVLHFFIVSNPPFNIRFT